MLLKLSYKGKRFSGSQIQPNSRTVEGELLNALSRCGYIESKESAELKIISRTDSGVSAAGNIARFNACKNIDIDRLNHELPDEIIVISKSHSKIRNPVSKHYCYLIDNKISLRLDGEKLIEASEILKGKHDFVNFSKLDRKSEKTTLRSIDINVERDKNFFIIHFYGKGFLWQMIRRIVRCMTDYASGKIDADIIRDYLEPNKMNRDYPPAKPDGLILVSIDAGVDFKESKRARKSIDKKMGVLEKELFFFSQL